MIRIRGLESDTTDTQSLSVTVRDRTKEKKRWVSRKEHSPTVYQYDRPTTRFRTPKYGDETKEGVLYCCCTLRFVPDARVPWGSMTHSSLGSLAGSIPRLAI